MKTWKHKGTTLVLVHSKYENNNLDYVGFYEKRSGEPYVDVSCNTPYNEEGTITLSHDLLDLCKSLADDFVKEYCEGEAEMIATGFVSSPKYKVNMEKLLADAIEL